MVPAVSTVYVNQQLLSLVTGDAAQREIVRSLPVQLTILDTVRRGLPGHALCVLFLLRQRPLHQVLLEFLGPAFLLGLKRQEQASS